MHPRTRVAHRVGSLRLLSCSGGLRESLVSALQSTGSRHIRWVLASHLRLYLPWSALPCLLGIVVLSVGLVKIDFFMRGCFFSRGFFSHDQSSAGSAPNSHSKYSQGRYHRLGECLSSAVNIRIYPLNRNERQLQTLKHIMKYKVYNNMRSLDVLVLFCTGIQCLPFFGLQRNETELTIVLRATPFLIVQGNDRC